MLLSHSQTRNLVSTSATGRKQTCGGAKLKLTQAYPYLFGMAVANLYARHRLQLVAAEHAICAWESSLDEITLDELCPAGDERIDLWTDACLDSVVQVLMQLAEHQV